MSQKVLSSALCPLIVVAVGVLSRLVAVENPSGVFWDEHFFVAAAQKYLHGIFFMEPHPPLGKLLIAAGEGMFGRNERTDLFLDTDFPGDAPEGYSLLGYRLIPSFLGGGAALFIYLIALHILRRPLWCMAIAALYLFDNALMLHTRGALLEGPQIFFCMGMVLVFLKLRERGDRSNGRELFLWVLLGLLFGCGITTKISSAIFIILPLVLLFEGRAALGAQVRRCGAFALTAVGVFVTVWTIHFSLGREIRPGAMIGSGFYHASQPYREGLTNGTFHPLLDFRTALADHWSYFRSYERKVPPLNLCQPSEPGSYPLLWPLGATPQAYRWKEVSPDTWRLWYLVPNPVVWFVVLGGVLTAAALVLASLILPGVRLRDRSLLVTLLAVYGGYMGVMLMIPRVMYLSHYLIPLCVGVVLFGAVANEIAVVAGREVTDRHRTLFFTALIAVTVLGFARYAPLTYGMPITVEEIQERSLLQVWNLRCPTCPSRHPFARPLVRSSR